MGVLRLFRYEDCVEADWSDWFASDAWRASTVLAAGEIVFLSLVVPRLTQNWILRSADAAPSQFPRGPAIRLGVAALVLLAVSAPNLQLGALRPQLAAVGVGILAASVSILLWSVRGSMRGAGIGTLIIVVLPWLVAFAKAAPAGPHWLSNHEACGSRLYAPLFYSFVLLPHYLPILPAMASLVALLVAGVMSRASGRSADPEASS
jgi:protein-S-isoprenylcysteine O-methyltransferase Ste14